MSKYIYDENVFLKIDNFDNIYFEEKDSVLNIRLVKIEDGLVKEFFEDDLKFDLSKYNNTKKELKKRENQILGTAAQSPINIGKKAAETADNILDGND